MNLGLIKELVKRNGDKFIVIENDEPEVVMMSFREYRRLLDEVDTALRPVRMETVSAHPVAPVINDISTDIINDTIDHIADTANRDDSSDMATKDTFSTPLPKRTSPPRHEMHDLESAPAHLDDIRLEDLPI